MTRQQLQNLLGDPPEWLVTRKQKRFQVSSIWKYGSIEFYFSPYSDDMYMIFSDHLPLVGCETLTLDPWILRSGLQFEEALERVEQADLAYHITRNSGVMTSHLTVTSRVTLNFHHFDAGLPLAFSGFTFKAAS